MRPDIEGLRRKFADRRRGTGGCMCSRYESCSICSSPDPALPTSQEVEQLIAYIEELEESLAACEAVLADQMKARFSTPRPSQEPPGK